MQAGGRRIAVPREDGATLHSRSDGVGGVPLLCCNSLGADLSSWDAQVPIWAAHREVIRFDARGHGASTTSPSPYSIDQLGRDAVAVLDAHEVDRADLCGLSLGGLVALRVAIDRPERVRRLVLACSAPRIGTRDGWEQRATTVLEGGGTAAVSAAVLERFFSRRFAQRMPEIVAAVESELLRVSPVGYAGCCLALAEADLDHALASITAPTLVIAGSEDIATPPDVVRRLHEGIAGSEWLEIDGAGHLANIEEPERFSLEVERFLSRS